MNFQLLSCISKYVGGNTEAFADIISTTHVRCFQSPWLVKKSTFVTSPEDISAVYKNPESLTFDGYVKDMYAAFGMSSRGIESMFAPIEGSSKSVNTKVLPSQRQAHLGTGI